MEIMSKKTTKIILITLLILSLAVIGVNFYSLYNVLMGNRDTLSIILLVGVIFWLGYNVNKVLIMLDDLNSKK